jgi:formylmethanofuran dehydrogenase subunit C
VIRLELQTSLDQVIEIDGLLPNRTASLSQLEISSLPVLIGSRRASVGDFFNVQGERSDHIAIEGDLKNVDGLGAGCAGGELLIHGAVGHRVGAGMTGGRIDVRGDVGDDAGVGMQGGVLRVGGDAGHRLGAAAPGSAKGLSGGEIVVNGSAGREAAARARRGLVVVGGTAGDDAGRAMIAGTLITFGRMGTDPGRGSKRGSIVALGGINVPASYVFACAYQPTYLRLVLTYLQRQHGLKVEARVLDGTYNRYCGDMASLGRGEILELAQL